MSNIGVEVSTTIRSGPTQTGPVSGRLHISAVTETGPVAKASLVRSIAEFQTIYGARTAYAAHGYDTARLFFEEGGSELIVSRVAGPAAAADSLTISDTLAAPTLRIETLYPGTNSNPYTVTVTADAGVTLTVAQDGKTVATFSGTTPAQIAASASRSPHVRILDLGSVTPAPGNLPAAAASASITGGTDDRASITAANVIAALDSAGEIGEGGAVAAPGYSATVIGSLLIDHAARFNKVALLAEDAAATEEEVLAVAEGLIRPAGASGGVFWPHMVIPDGSGTRTVSPEGYVAAVRARAHAEVGYWRKPFGEIASTRWALGTNVAVNKETNDRLSAGQVNGIITSNSKVRLYNWVSLASDRSNLGSLRDRDVLNNLTRDIKAALEPFVGRDIDGRGHLTGQVEGEVTGVVAVVSDGGGLFALFDSEGEEIDPGYKVIVDQSINPLTKLATNTLSVQVLVRLSPTADLILVEIIKVPLEGVL